MGILDITKLQNNAGDTKLGGLLKKTVLPSFSLGKNLIMSPQTLAKLSKLVKARYGQIQNVWKGNMG